MTKRKWAWVMGAVGVSVLGFGLLAGTFAVCGPPRFAGGDGRPRVGDGGGPCGFRGKRFVERFENHLDGKVEDLNLSDAQKELYAEFKGEVKTRLIRGFEKRGEFMTEMETEIKKANPDINAVAELVKKKLSEFPAAMEGYVDLIVSFYGILDEDQQKKVIATIRERMERHHKRFGPLAAPSKGIERREGTS